MSSSSVADPITKIFLVTAKEHLKASQTIAKILACTQRGHDADLYESSWRSKGKRYLCFEKESSSNYVITDLLIVKDDEPVPNGFTGVFLTEDTDEKALKRHILCVKNEPRANAKKAITDLVLINQSKGEKAGQQFYTISHEVNEMNLTFCVDNFSQPNPSVLPHQNSNPKLNEVPLQTAGSIGTNKNSRPHPTFTRSSSIAISPVTAIDGIPFEINPKFSPNSLTNDPLLSSIPILTVHDINAKYTYNFNLENETIRKP